MAISPPQAQQRLRCLLEKEEQVRLQARKRLEEQLKQYRVKRQQERVSLLSNQLMENSRQSVIIRGSAVYFSLLGWACVCLCKDHLSHVVPTL